MHGKGKISMTDRAGMELSVVISSISALMLAASGLKSPSMTRAMAEMRVVNTSTMVIRCHFVDKKTKFDDVDTA